MTAGDTFYVRDGMVDTHLWVILSDPEDDPDRVVLVSMTSFEPHKESVCLLEAGDHPRVSGTTCIAFNEARLTTLGSLQAFHDRGFLSIQEPVSESLLRRIRDGVSKSTRIKFKIVEILLEQGVIE